MRGVRTLLIVLASALAGAPAAEAFLIQEKGGPQSASSGIALGPDGNFWVAEEFTGSVVRMTQDGNVVDRYTVGDGPTSVATGPGGRVWVAVTGANKLVWFDAQSPNPTLHDRPLDAGCGPVALVAGNDGRMYLSRPSDGGCNGGDSVLARVPDNGGGSVENFNAGNGTVFDLEVAGGKLFAPDFGGDVVRRISLDVLSVESVVQIPTSGGGPDGITSDGSGNLWVTEWNSGKVARFPQSQQNGSAIEFTPSGGPLVNPFGIVVGPDGRIYIAGKGSSNIVRLNADGTGWAFYPVNDAEPFNIINGTDGDFWCTDQKKTRLLRLINGAPRASTGAATPTGPSSGTVNGAVDPRGNETQVVFDYGPTEAYGQTSAPIAVPNGASVNAVSSNLAGLVPESLYHVRVRATNGEGSTLGSDTTFTTGPFPELTANTNFEVRFRKRKVLVKAIRITRLRGGETAIITCKGKGCPFKSRSFSLAAGKRTFGAKLFRRRAFKRGVKIAVLVTAPDAVGTATTLKIRKKPKVSRACVRPGETKASACP